MADRNSPNTPAAFAGLFFLLLLLAASPAELLAQEVRGTVTDAETDEPIPGVNVVVDETTIGTTTNLDGEYELELPSGDVTLVFSFVGYLSQEVPVEQREEIDVALEEDIAGLEEVVVVGYGTSERRNVTGSIGSVDVSEVTETTTFDNPGQIFQGRVPGLHASVATEAKGNTSLQVRGRNSINASNNPLIVVDGMTYYGDLSDINPQDIESIDVLKGASAAAVYGASAAAGVVEVTTKRGATPAPTITFNSSVGVATQGDVVEPYGPEDYVQYRQDAAIRQNPHQPDYYYADPRDLPSDISLEEWEALGSGSGDPVEVWLGRLGLASNEIRNYMEGEMTDWHDQVVRGAALRQNYNLSVSGSPESLTYYASLSYVDNEGQPVGERFQTVRGRMNLETTVADWVKLDFHSQFASRDEGFLGANVDHAGRVSPLGDMYADDGTLEWYPHNDGTAQNPFLWTSQSGREYEWKNTNVIANLRGELIDLPFGLGYNVHWTNYLDFRRNYNFVPSTVPAGEPAGNGSRQEYNNYRWQLDNILTWNRSLADIHDLDATFLFNVEVDNEWNTVASAEEFPIEVLKTGGLPLGSEYSITSDDTRTTGASFMGRLNYQLLERYLLTLTYRRDGYSAFGQTNPYASFPSLALAWQIDEEPFFEVGPVSNLKLRLSWGENGNRSIGTYSALQRLSTMKYMYGSDTITGFNSTNLPNPNLKWERTEQYNLGLDFGLFDDRITGTVDVYHMSTKDLLLLRSLPEISGYNNIWSNLGEVVNRGAEVSLNSANVTTETVSWSSTLNFSLNRNEIKDLYGDGEDDRQNNWFIGEALDRIYDYEVLGIWQEDEAEEAAEYGFEPGDFKLRDVDGDGSLTPVEDKVFQGYTEPRYRISLVNDLRYKNVTFSALINSWLGHYAAHNVHKHVGYEYGRHNRLDYPYWTPENPTDEWARLASEGANPDFNYWENTSFVKLQSLSAAYQIPESLVDRFNMESLRVYFSARNVFSLTGFDGGDPETHSYTTPRLYTLGINVGF